MSVIFYTFQQQICSMTEQDLFYLALQRVEGVGDIMAKNYSLIAVAQRQFKTKTAQLAAIDGVGSMLLRNLKSQAILIKPMQN
jgi:DNA processing protein